MSTVDALRMGNTEQDRIAMLAALARHRGVDADLDASDGFQVATLQLGRLMGNTKLTPDTAADRIERLPGRIIVLLAVSAVLLTGRPLPRHSRVRELAWRELPRDAREAYGATGRQSHAYVDDVKQALRLLDELQITEKDPDVVDLDSYAKTEAKKIRRQALRLRRGEQVAARLLTVTNAAFDQLQRLDAEGVGGLVAYPLGDPDAQSWAATVRRGGPVIDRGPAATTGRRIEALPTARHWGTAEAAAATLFMLDHTETASYWTTCWIELYRAWMTQHCAGPRSKPPADADAVVCAGDYLASQAARQWDHDAMSVLATEGFTLGVQELINDGRDESVGAALGRMQAAEAPAPRGTIVFATPLHPDWSEHPIRALGWSIDFSWHPVVPPMITVVAYLDPAVAAAVDLRNVAEDSRGWSTILNDITPQHRGLRPWLMVGADGECTAGTPEAHVINVLRTAFALARTPRVRKYSQQVSIGGDGRLVTRRPRRSAKRMPDGIRVLSLRPLVDGQDSGVAEPAGMGAPLGGNTGTGALARSGVRQHWVAPFRRNQWYPSLKGHKMIVIEGHLRGDPSIGTTVGAKELHVARGGSPDLE